MTTDAQSAVSAIFHSNTSVRTASYSVAVFKVNQPQEALRIG